MSRPPHSTLRVARYREGTCRDCQGCWVFFRIARKFVNLGGALHFRVRIKLRRSPTLNHPRIPVAAGGLGVAVEGW